MAASRGSRERSTQRAPWHTEAARAGRRIIPAYRGGVAQQVRALPCHGRGRGFESRRSRFRHRAFPTGIVEFGPQPGSRVGTRRAAARRRSAHPWPIHKCDPTPVALLLLVLANLDAVPNEGLTRVAPVIVTPLSGSAFGRLRRAAPGCEVASEGCVWFDGNDRAVPGPDLSEQRQQELWALGGWAARDAGRSWASHEACDLTLIGADN